jgi:SAM-dependent methyltransferase
MDQQEKWHEYWKNHLLVKHGKTEVTSEDDLYLQVARTENKKPITKELFELIIQSIDGYLHLQPTDVLVDFCCGNGLFTYELKDKVARIIGVDFAEDIILAARKFKPADNIDYCLDTVTGFLDSFRQKFPGVHPDKYLMNDSIAYFITADLRQMLEGMKRISPNGFIAAFRGAPDDALKWNYYSKPEWKQRYLDNVAKGDFTNDGLGRWWPMDEVEVVCKELALQCTLVHQPGNMNNYRTDIIIRHQ